MTSDASDPVQTIVGSAAAQLAGLAAIIFGVIGVGGAMLAQRQAPKRRPVLPDALGSRVARDAGLATPTPRRS